ncbi:MAG: diadenylate cyclase [Saccharofermentanaceae bacterium]
MPGYSIIEQIFNFLNELVKSLANGYLFFGSVWDVVRSISDIVLVTVLVYWILLFIRQSRAWQLVKGIVFILIFVIVCSLFGLDMVGFLFNKFLYGFAILFIVIFQPELRRALENVGLKSFGSLRSFISNSDVVDSEYRVGIIHEICLACKEMSKSNTGALILIERTTRLDELLTQENVVRFDSTVTSSVLQSIFYKGSPMHDGALLVRDGKIIAARCHVPLSITMHSLQRTGTRHRAAVGASEMGDTIAIAVSEERGKTSIAVNGKLFEMKDENELEANLFYLLGLDEQHESKKSFVKSIENIFSRKSNKSISSDEANELVTAGAEQKPSKDINLSLPSDSSTKKRHKHTSFSEKAILIILSFILSTCLWMYIQVINNPVVTKTITVPISYNYTTPNMEVSYPINSVELEIVGRQETIDNLQAGDIIATIDYSGVTGIGVMELPVIVKPGDSGIYFRVEQQIPETVSVTVYDSSES